MYVQHERLNKKNHTSRMRIELLFPNNRLDTVVAHHIFIPIQNWMDHRMDAYEIQLIERDSRE
jgi:hypothetical protein